MIRRIEYRPTAPSAGTVEVVTVETLRRRGGASEFAAPQRLAFELLVVVESASYEHEVDFTVSSLALGDVLWVHAGQVQQWGSIADLEGVAVLFPAASLPTRAAELLDARGALKRNVWPAAAAPGGLLAGATSTLLSMAAGLTDPAELDAPTRVAALEHAVAACLLLLAAGPVPDAPDRAGIEVFRWFEEEIERSFSRERSVASYAARVGYSARTLNRAAQANAGVTAKELIDDRVVLEAKRMLAHETVPAVEIARRLGFPDAANFSSYFRHRAGMTPGEFRRTVGRSRP